MNEARALVPLSIRPLSIPPLSANPFRIALLTHSTLPRGGVVHALELGDALASRGHEVTLYAPDVDGSGLFRAPRSSSCRFVSLPVSPAENGLVDLVEQRIQAWLDYFRRHPGACKADVFHAQDSISANALATLTEEGVIPGFMRTVHHLDHFTDPRLAAWQHRGVMAADALLCVSKTWQDVLLRDYQRCAGLVSNGVDRQRFRPADEQVADVADAADADVDVADADADADVADSADLEMTEKGPLFLSIGGIEARKNTLNALRAFAAVRAQCPQARWMIAGGASLLDHSRYARAFYEEANASGLRIADRTTGSISPAANHTAPIQLLGCIHDADMPALFHQADALLFPSVKEGFGLVVLEALSSGVPVVVSRIAPFTEYLHEACVEWAVPDDPASIANAMLRAVHASPARRVSRRAAGIALSEAYGWENSAAQHEVFYHAFMEDFSHA